MAEEEEVVEVLEVAGRWEWEDFFKEVCQNYAQWEVKNVLFVRARFYLFLLPLIRSLNPD